MPEQFDENKAEAEAVAMAEALEPDPGEESTDAPDMAGLIADAREEFAEGEAQEFPETEGEADAKPKRTPKADATPDAVLFLAAAQRLQARGIATGHIPYFLTLNDETSEYQVTQDWGSGKIVIEDTQHQTRRSQINTSRRHAETQWYSHHVMLKNAKDQEQIHRDNLDHRLKADQNTGVLTPPNWIAACELNIENLQAAQVRIQPLVDHWQDKIDSLDAELKNLPARRQWHVAVEGPLSIEYREVTGNERG